MASSGDFAAKRFCCPRNTDCLRSRSDESTTVYFTSSNGSCCFLLYLRTDPISRREGASDQFSQRLMNHTRRWHCDKMLRVQISHVERIGMKTRGNEALTLHHRCGLEASEVWRHVIGKFDTQGLSWQSKGCSCRAPGEWVGDPSLVSAASGPPHPFLQPWCLSPQNLPESHMSKQDSARWSVDGLVGKY